MGATKRGKGTKIMAIADRNGLPVALWATSATPHETQLVEELLIQRSTSTLPKKQVGDRAYDSDPLDFTLAEQGIELIAPHRRTRVKPQTQDGRPLRRYKRRWKVERLFAWLHNFRRIVTRYEYKLENFLGFLRLAGFMILAKKYL